MDFCKQPFKHFKYYITFFIMENLSCIICLTFFISGLWSKNIFNALWNTFFKISEICEKFQHIFICFECIYIYIIFESVPFIAEWLPDNTNYLRSGQFVLTRSIIIISKYHFSISFCLAAIVLYCLFSVTSCNVCKKSIK